MDGIEIVASLVLLADRRTGRKSGWLPWAALIIGTAASLAANVATADPGTISRLIAGWPALALLIAVKLLSGMLEHRDPVGHPGLPVPADVPGGDCPGLDGPGSKDQAAPPSPVPVPPAPDRSVRRRNGHRPPSRRDATRPAPHIGRDAVPRRPAHTVPDATPAGQDTADAAPSPSRAGTVHSADTDLAALLPAARTARDELHRDGHPLTRDNLARRLRQAGHPVRNSRLTPLLHALRTEAATPSPAST